MGRNIGIATDFVDYPADGRQIQCSVSFCAKSDGDFLSPIVSPPSRCLDLLAPVVWQDAVGEIIRLLHAVRL